MQNAEFRDMTRRLFYGIVSVFLVLISQYAYGIAGSGLSQQSINIKVNSVLVTTDVTVNGNVVPDLRADDFIIADNGVVQTISHFSRDLNPIAVALLIDSSHRQNIM